MLIEVMTSVSNGSSGFGHTKYVFTFEEYANGTPVPTDVKKDVDMTLEGPFLWWFKSDFSK